MHFDITSKEFKELMVEALLDSRLDISSFQRELKQQYKKSWGASEWLENRLSKEFARIIIDHMISIIQEKEFEQKEGSD